MFKAFSISAHRAYASDTLTGNKTLALTDNQVQKLDPGGAGRDITLPPEELSTGLSFLIRNTADAAEILDIKNDAGATVCTPTQNQTAIVWCNGVEWLGVVMDHT